MSDPARQDDHTAQHVRLRRGVLFALVYVILLFHLNDFIGDQMIHATLTLSMAMVERGTVALDDYVEGTGELSHHNGHFYSGIPPGQSLVAVPLYFVVRPALASLARRLQPSLKLVPRAHVYRFDKLYVVRRLLLALLFQLLLVLPCAAFVPLMVCDLGCLVSEEHTRRVQGLSFALLLPLGSLWWAYGGGGGPRVMGACLLLLPVWWLGKRQRALSARRSIYEAAGLGLGAGLAGVMRYEMLVAALVITVYFVAVASRRYRIVFVLAFALPLTFTGWYHNRCFGSVGNVPYNSKLRPKSVIENELGGTAYVEEWTRVNGELMGAANEGRGLGLSAGNIADALWRSSESLLRFTPALVLAPFGLWWLWGHARRLRPITMAAAVVVVAGVGLLSVWPHPGFRGAVGPRYLLWALPFWVMLVAPVWSLMPRVLQWLVFVACCVPSYLAAMFTERVHNAYQFSLVQQFGLSNYLLSRAQEARLAISPTMSTAICLAFWALVITVFFWPRSPWCLFRRTGAAPDSSELSHRIG